MQNVDVSKLLKKIEIESEDLVALTNTVQYKLNNINDLSDSEIESIDNILEEIYRIKDSLSRNITNLKRKAKGN